ncbi:serine hydrolase domain-containing protein [Microbulbifer harenosus]|uniref:Beta-lactamase family protein n=1 Tax=Microbulbifer harenosus TaxID=2576840 RepID=A0ABY2UJ55_9GAMM|nr:MULTISPECIES: serine hydrolase domain-containing protein [Microbulbifer]QIL89022.1 serine hydrolase [Microbulbifer sp. SH-1]TLM77755.1 beta-lactamase family protein [Microbulbifer harenosus]
MDIQGYCAPGYEALYDAFASNFRDHGDTGASFCAVLRGEIVASLWAGSADRDGARPFEEHTLTNVFSSSKGVLALIALQQVAAGRLDLDLPVAHYWPEFAAAGKQDITGRQLLCHRSGVIAFREKVADDLIYDWEAALRQVAATEPWWTPGSRQGYAPFLYGWTLGGLIEKASGLSLMSLYCEGVAEPLALDGGFGAVGHRSTSIADVGPLKKPLPELRDNAIGRSIKEDRQGPVATAFTNPVTLMMGTNGASWRGALIPAANGHFSARDLATIYGDLASEAPALLPADLLRTSIEEQSRGQDAILQAEVAFACGFIRSGEAQDLYFGSPAGFGHPGAGGSIGFADPLAEVGFGYVTSRMGQSLFMDQRAVGLMQCLYRLL